MAGTNNVFSCFWFIRIKLPNAKHIYISEISAKFYTNFYTLSINEEYQLVICLYLYIYKKAGIYKYIYIYKHTYISFASK